MGLWRDVFSAIGIVYTLVILIALAVIAWRHINDYLLGMKYRYRQKHRFDKPPIAECYCIDCEYYSSDDGNHICSAHYGWYVADNWFCWSATRKKHTTI